MNVTAMATRERPAGGALAIWDREQLEVIKTLICPGASDAELALFGQVCQKTGLDPFSRQIYGLMRGQRQQVNGEWKTVERLSIQTSIDGFRLIAERSGKYGGQVGPQWCGPDGQWRDVWLDSAYPAAARVGVIRTDWREPLYAVARWDSYVQTYRDRKSNQQVVGAMWERMPDVMLAKVAESLALRRAFPAELSGLYTSEEMHQADREAAPAIGVGPAPVTPVDDQPADDRVRDIPASPPANAATRKKLAEQWPTLVARAVACGVAPDEMPPATATAAELQAAQRALVEAIKNREKLNTVLRDRIGLANAQGANLNEVDPATLTDAEVHDQIATCDRILEAAEQAEPESDDMPF